MTTLSNDQLIKKKEIILKAIQSPMVREEFKKYVDKLEAENNE